MLRSTAVTAALLLCLLLSACQSAVLPDPTRAVPPQQTARPTQTPTQAPRLPTLTPPARPTTIPLDLQVKPEALKGVTIHFWHPWSGETAKQVQEIVDQFNHENVWGVKVVVEALGGTPVLFDQVNAALETPGQAPVVVAASPDALANWHERQAVIDLNVYIRSADWGLTQAEIDDFSPAVWQDLELDGARLGIPAEHGAQVLFYNRSWARELGFSNPPQTTAEFQQQACTAAKALLADGGQENDGMGGWVIDRDAMTLLSWMAAFGAQPPSAASDRYAFNSPEAAAAFTYLRGLFDQGCAWLSRNPLPYEYFATRRALFYSGDLSEIALQQKMSAHLSSPDAWTVLPFPSNSGQPVLLSSGTAYALLDNEPAEQLAGWLLVRWLILPRNQARLVKAGLSLPVGQQAQKELVGMEKTMPAWAAAVQHLDSLTPAPSLPDWWLARNILEDAGWQMLQPTAQAPSAVLKQLDETLADILQHQSQP